MATVLIVLSRGRAPRTDLTRAAAILFGGWLVVDGLVLSFMQGVIHRYYCLSIAPPVAAMFAIGVHELWQRREKWLYRVGLAVLFGGTGVWGWWILGRNASWLPILRWTILVIAVMARDRPARAVDSGDAPQVRAWRVGCGARRCAGRARGVCVRHDRSAARRRRTVCRAR